MSETDYAAWRPVVVNGHVWHLHPDGAVVLSGDDEDAFEEPHADALRRVVELEDLLSRVPDMRWIAADYRNRGMYGAAAQCERWEADRRKLLGLQA